MDLKYLYELRAEEIAREEHGKEYENLSWVDQMRVYDRAMDEVYDDLIAQADARRHTLKEE